ncbi:MAG: HAD-IIB family hydrolase [Deferribacteres bacterium]|nr:HAD-IIB family hydrolase [Deferribacteres bacterium]
MKARKKNLIIFTDMDGTLLDSEYSFKKALPALELIKEKKIPLVLCSSKTRAEIERYRMRLENTHPFISENGGGIFIPENYFRPEILGRAPGTRGSGDYIVIKLGTDYAALRKALEELRSEGFDITGFGDMSSTEIAALTGLEISEAALAARRDFDEPFKFKGDETALRKLLQRIRSKGLNYTQGELLHLTGNNDKGRAVEILKQLYKGQYGAVVTAALGDSPNDIEMLKKVDYPIVIRKNDGSCNPQILREVEGCIKADGPGPEGWNRAVIKLLETMLL